MRPFNGWKGIVPPSLASQRSLSPSLFIPRNSPAEPVVERGPRPEVEQPFGLARVQRAARLAVWFGRVPCHLALVPGQLGDEADKIANADLQPRTHVDWIGSVVVL